MADERSPIPNLREDQHVWLVPKTIGAPAICWKGAKATVRRVHGLWVTVAVDGQEYRVHVDNIRRSEPEYRPPAPRRGPKPMVMPEGYEEVPLI
jgi:hypothetical protein